ncbi:MAG: AtpZ/AtpI family protein [Pseudomonadota bacterium]
MNDDADFDRRLADARAAAAANRGKPGADETRASPMGMALRIGVDLVAGVVVGTGVGWLLDRLLGIFPVLTIVFFFVGGAAGILNVMRAARAMGLTGDPPDEPEQKGSTRGGSDRTV